MTTSTACGPCAWVEQHCPSIDGQFLFLDPQWWNTHLLSPGAALILREAALAIEERRFEAFLREIDDAGGWPPGLERLAQTLTLLGKACGGHEAGR